MDPCKKCGWLFKTIWIAVSLILIAPALGSGWLNDDYFFSSTFSSPPSPFGYYDYFGGYSTAYSPWWTDAAFHLRFFRPLSSLTLYLDFALWPDAPILMHLHSALWLVVLLLGAFRLFELLLSARASKWAMILFSVGLFHAWAAGWIAARHGIMAGAFLSWAMAMTVKGIQSGRNTYQMVALMLFVLALLSSEAGLAFGAAATLYYWAEETDVKRRLKRMAPVVGIAAGYLVAYVAAGYGARASGLYVDPFHSPADLLQIMPAKMLALLASFTFGLPAMMLVLPGMEKLPVVVGVFALLCWSAVLLLIQNNRQNEQKRLLAWAIPAVFLCMLPEMSGLTEGRGSLLSATLFCAVAAETMVHLFKQPSRLKRVAAWGTGGILVLGLLLVSPLSRAGAGFFIAQGSSALVRNTRQSEIICPLQGNYFLINADPMLSGMAPFLIAAHRGTIFKSFEQLGLANGDIQITRVGKNELVLASSKGVVDSWLQLFRRRDKPLKTGDVVERAAMTIRVLTVTGAKPTEISVTVHGDMQKACFLTADGQRLKTIELPDVNGQTTVEWHPPML